jgi:undecaprenyl-diphosphatase
MTRRASDVWALLGGLVILAITWGMALSSDIASWEEDLFRFINDWPDWLEAPTWPIMQAGQVLVVPISALAAWWAWGRWRPAIGLLLGGLSAWLLAKVVKDLVERGRPSAFLTDITQRPMWSGLGFVSGHAATAFAIATIISPYLSRPLRYVVWGLAVATIVLRMYTAAHLPLDVIGGAGLGVAVGATVNLIGGVPTEPWPLRAKAEAGAA